MLEKEPVVQKTIRLVPVLPLLLVLKGTFLPILECIYFAFGGSSKLLGVLEGFLVLDISGAVISRL